MFAVRPYYPADWYYQVPGNATQVFSSKRGLWVTASSDGDYNAWLGDASQGKSYVSQMASVAALYDEMSARVPSAAAALAVANAADLTPAQHLSALLAGGLTVTSTANQATLGGTYPTDPVSQGKIAAIAAGIAAGKGLPGGGSTVGIVDMAGAVHNFSSADFLNLAAAIEEFVYQCYSAEAVLLAGGTATFPAATATIA